MPYADREVALARKRAWAKANPPAKVSDLDSVHTMLRSERVQGGDENWVVLVCEDCFEFFDSPRGTGKYLKLCRACRKLRRQS
jgi:hypothetical protein